MNEHSADIRALRELIAEVLNEAHDADDLCLTGEDADTLALRIISVFGLEQASCSPVCGCGLVNRPLYLLGAGCYDEGEQSGSSGTEQ